MASQDKNFLKKFNYRLDDICIIVYNISENKNSKEVVKMKMKKVFKKAHEMTRKFVEKYGVDYRAQFGLCLSYLLEKEKEESNMKIKMKELKGTPKQIKFADDIKKAVLEIIERLPEAIVKYSKNEEMVKKYMGRFKEVKKLFESYEDAGKFINDWKVVVYTNNKAERFDIIVDKLEEIGIKITWRILAKLQEEYFITY